MGWKNRRKEGKIKGKNKQLLVDKQYEEGEIL